MYSILKKSPIIVIYRNVPLEITIPYTQAVLSGGITAFEVALNTPHALEQIRLMKREFGEQITIGAGTATDLRLCHDALSAGASFLLSPGSNPEVLRFCSQNQIRFMPGVMTPSDVELCVNHGFHVLKLFPAGDLPAGYIKSLKGPFDTTDYVAVGGVKADNITGFLASGFIGVGIGSNLVPKEVMERKDWAAATTHIIKLVSSISGQENKTK